MPCCHSQGYAVAQSHFEEQMKKMKKEIRREVEESLKNKEVKEESSSGHQKYVAIIQPIRVEEEGSEMADEEDTQGGVEVSGPLFY